MRTALVAYNAVFSDMGDLSKKECNQCGEKYYTDEAAEKLEIIVNMDRELMREIAVIDYKQAASLLQDRSPKDRGFR